MEPPREGSPAAREDDGEEERCFAFGDELFEWSKRHAT